MYSGLSLSLFFFIYSSIVLQHFPYGVNQGINETNYDAVDMETSALVEKFIATNIPATDLLVERHFPKTLLLPTSHQDTLFDDLNITDYKQQVDHERTIVELDQIVSLLQICRKENCGAKVSTIREIISGSVFTFKIVC